eukprot:15478140-Alexandrium_andersonii.AAC.1
MWLHIAECCAWSEPGLNRESIRNKSGLNRDCCRQPLCGCTLKSVVHGLSQEPIWIQSGNNRGSTGTAAEPGLSGNPTGNQ